jgi:hypothetical protein
MDFPGIIKKILSDQDLLFGASAVLSPIVANFVRDAGYDTVEKFTEYIMKPAVEGQKPHFRNPREIQIIVTGGSNNNYYSYGGMRYNRSVLIDKWR